MKEYEYNKNLVIKEIEDNGFSFYTTRLVCDRLFLKPY